MMELAKLYRLAESDNITVDCFDLEYREAMSIKNDNGECYIAINPFKLTGEVDEKMKLAHELGHCETGSFYNRYSPCDVRQKHENRADKWAIKKLVPKDELEEAVRQGYTEMWELAEYFGVTDDYMRMVICWYTYGTLETDNYFSK